MHDNVFKFKFLGGLPSRAGVGIIDAKRAPQEFKGDVLKIILDDEEQDYFKKNKGVICFGQNNLLYAAQNKNNKIQEIRIIEGWSYEDGKMFNLSKDENEDHDGVINFKEHKNIFLNEIKSKNKTDLQWGKKIIGTFEVHSGEFFMYDLYDFPETFNFYKNKEVA